MGDTGPNSPTNEKLLEEIGAVNDDRVRVTGEFKTPPSTPIIGAKGRIHDKLGVVISGNKVSYSEAIDVIGDYSFNICGTPCIGLKQALEKLLDAQNRWGMIHASIESTMRQLMRGRKALVISNVSQYRAMLDGASVNEVCLMNVIEAMRRGVAVLPIFDAGILSPRETFAVLFDNKLVPSNLEEIDLIDFKYLKKILPESISNAEIATLHHKLDINQREILKKAASQAEQLPTSPRILFTYDTREVEHTVGSLSDDLASAIEERDFIDPECDFIRARMQIDSVLAKILSEKGESIFDLSREKYRAALQNAFQNKTIHKELPDQNTTTRYPLHIFKDGSVLAFLFDASENRYKLIALPPSRQSSRTGGRNTFNKSLLQY